MSASQFVPFRFVLLSIFPGFLLTLRGLGIYFFASEVSDLLLLLAVVLYSLLLIFTELRRAGKLETWAFPLLGSALWALWFLWNLIIFDPRVADYLLDFVLKLLSLAGLFVAYKYRKALSRDILYLFAAWVMALMLLEFARTTLFLSLAQSALISISKWIIHLLPFLALCIILIRESKVESLLLSCSYIPFLIWNYLSQGIGINVWKLDLSEVILARLAIQVIPHLFFLVIMPLVLLGIRMNKARLYLVSVTSCLVIFYISYNRVYVLQDPGTPFGLLPWAMLTYFVLIIISPTIFSLFLFQSKSPKNWEG